MSKTTYQLNDDFKSAMASLSFVDQGPALPFNDVSVAPAPVKAPTAPGLKNQFTPG